MYMNNECPIVHDLSSSYIDQLCSEESSRFIEQHISTCKSCAELLEEMHKEIDIQKQQEFSSRLEQKKPFQKLARYFNAQNRFMKFSGYSFWITLIITLGFFINSVGVFTQINREKEKVQLIDQEQHEIMKKSFSLLTDSSHIDTKALQDVFQEYKGKLKFLAVFSEQNIEDNTVLKEGPTYTYPIDYSQAKLIIGEKGKITQPIIPNNYDIGTVAMADDQWIVQYEYKESYLKTVENAFQIKHYAPSTWTVFQIPITLMFIPIILATYWFIQKRIIKQMKNN